MPLITELRDRANRPKGIAWSWEDRMILASFVLLDGGQVGEATFDRKTILNWGYVGAGCEHTFTQEFGYSQVDTRKTIWVRPGQSYHEWRGH